MTPLVPVEKYPGAISHVGELARFLAFLITGKIR
jgi:hypothetical protein